MFELTLSIYPVLLGDSRAQDLDGVFNSREILENRQGRQARGGFDWTRGWVMNEDLPESFRARSTLVIRWMPRSRRCPELWVTSGQPSAVMRYGVLMLSEALTESRLPWIQARISAEKKRLRLFHTMLLAMTRSISRITCGVEIFARGKGGQTPLFMRR